MINPIQTCVIVYNRLRYQLVALKCRFIYGKYAALLRYFRVRIEIASIERRLFRKGHSYIYLLKVLARFVRMRRYIATQETRSAHRFLGQQIVDISVKTGIPQWELRAKLERDFNLDI